MEIYGSQNGEIGEISVRYYRNKRKVCKQVCENTAFA
jgi:hypothetical protein